ncbi:3-phosphoserine/phosphohydroxythreonine transaminase [Duganella sp. FT3S]|uniref:Phosphoserine aminotransferase n=1 Tax=Rugamonas fusca TaxID=2758568 RepID=A0A7W2I822_9BURK|nr:3-phosphoserine/phosphohydroxythreonine transaminase [Rugamonas fusca]MBA5607069.1 3-phosphoserine/phosphohydroxythreonine transaminase [Rugamonas fusca]
MNTSYNFAAGPSGLPAAVLERARKELFAHGDDGSTAFEQPFTGEAFGATLARARARLRDLLAVPDNYHILFLAGGATQQFSMVPLNLLGNAAHVAYADSGHWSQRAIREAGRYAAVTVAARYEGERPLAAPPLSAWRLPDDCAYCHITPNETADGIAYPALPDCGDVPLVADVTSCLLTAPLEVARFGLLYAAAQKNLGIAGMTVVIVRDDLLRRPAPLVPSSCDYRAQAAQESRANTPPTIAIALAGMMFDWIAQQGGLAEMHTRGQRKAALLYDAIDASGGFFRAPAAPVHRSPVNVRFELANSALTAPFIEYSARRGLHHLRGHSAFGGLRASLYNAMPEEGVRALIACMADFTRSYG